MNDRRDPSGKPAAPGWENASWGGERTAENAYPASSQLPPHQSAGDPLTRFLGGSPFAVLVKLLVMSLVVGALLMWLDIRPIDIFYGIERFFRRIWMLGFDAVRDIATYILAGAAIVVPVWFVLRLMNMRNR
ncbi:MAG: DUF6460 domain-containing protein [Beijerinckiaceae bacterium]